LLEFYCPARSNSGDTCLKIESNRSLRQPLVYNLIDEREELTAQAEIKWLQLQPKDNFAAQPYEQMAAVLRNMGHRLFVSELAIPGTLFRCYLRFHIIVGWILTTLWVGGVTGLIKS